MSLVRMNFQSKYLGNFSNINVLLPDRPRQADPKAFYSQGKKYKVVWLLHGTGGDCNEWLNMSRIMMYASERDLIVVMVSAMNSNYVNWPKFGNGYMFWDYMTEELMPMIYNWFPASDKREDNFIAGLSMGGGGTAKFAFGHPELFGGAAILSAGVKKYTEASFENSSDRFAARMARIVENAGGREAFLDSVENVWAMAKKQADAGVVLPKLYFATGDKDPVCSDYTELKAYLDSLGIPAKYEIFPGYVHEWRFWDMVIEKAFDYFDLPVCNVAAI